jgi:hypothetical protein
MSVDRVRCLGTGLLLSWVVGISAANAAPPCAGGGEPAMELRITATALAPETDRTLVVSVFDDGCVRVHRPAYRRDADEFRLDLDTAALTAFDAKRVHATQ